MNALESPIVVFDVETTGLHARLGDRIVELGAIKVEGGQRDSSFYSMVNPERPLSLAAMEVNGITEEDVADAPRITEVVPEFLDFVGDVPMVAHNAVFDLCFIALGVYTCNLPMSSNDVLCTCKLGRKILPGLLGGYSLENLVAELDVDAQPGHRAQADVEATWDVYRKLAQFATEDELPTLHQLLELQHGTVPWPEFDPDDLNFVPKTLLEKVLMRAMEREAKVRIEYVSKNGEFTVRDIRPFLLCRKNGIPYVAAYCHFRNDARTFCIDRIQNLIGN